MDTLILLGLIRPNGTLLFTPHTVISSVIIKRREKERERHYCMKKRGSVQKETKYRKLQKEHQGS